MNRLLVTLTVLTLLVAPLVMILAGLLKGRAPGSLATSVPRWPWSLTVRSTLLYTLAFNLTFFIQELFLVLPKALTPGLRPTLFHNNHSWQGDDPRAALFQGCGALAIFISAALSSGLLSRWRGRSTTTRWFLLWMTYSGFFMALPQVVVGALSPQSDVGMAMTYLGWSAALRAGAAGLALLCMPWLAFKLKDQVLRLAPEDARLADAGVRMAYVFKMATLPSALALPLIFGFRVPREWVEVLIVPMVVTVVGVLWIQATAWFPSGGQSSGGAVDEVSNGLLAGLALLLLLIFQLLLRPGIRFY